MDLSEAYRERLPRDEYDPLDRINYDQRDKPSYEEDAALDKKLNRANPDGPRRSGKE